MEESGPSALQGSVQYHHQWQTLVNEAEALRNARRGDLLSEQLQQLDMRRENALIGLQRIIEGSMFSPVAANRTAAVLLKNHRDRFGSKIARDNCQSQTTMVRRLIKDLSTIPGLVAAVSTLGLESWLTELTVANGQFGTQYLVRTRDTSGGSTETLRRKREATAEAWYALNDRPNAHNIINDGAAPYADTFRYINGLMEYYINLLLRRCSNGIEVPENVLKDTLPDN